MNLLFARLREDRETQAFRRQHSLASWRNRRVSGLPLLSNRPQKDRLKRGAALSPPRARFLFVQPSGPSQGSKRARLTRPFWRADKEKWKGDGGLVKEFTISKGNTYLTPLTDYPSLGRSHFHRKNLLIPTIYIYMYRFSVISLQKFTEDKPCFHAKFSVTRLIMLSQFSSTERDSILQRGKVSWVRTKIQLFATAPLHDQ